MYLLQVYAFTLGSLVNTRGYTRSYLNYCKNAYAKPLDNFSNQVQSGDSTDVGSTRNLT